MNCRDKSGWGEWAGPGSVDSFDFLPGRCAACGWHVMNIWRVPDSTYMVVGEKDAKERFARRPD
jgi:hypothetical protein